MINEYRKDTTKDHPLFGADPTEYFLAKNWRKAIPMIQGPRGYWFKVTFTNADSRKPYEWFWMDTDG